MSAKDRLREAIINAVALVETIVLAFNVCNGWRLRQLRMAAHEREVGIREALAMHTVGFGGERVEDRRAPGLGTAPVRRFAAPRSDAAAEEGLEPERDSNQVVMIVDDEPQLVELAAEMIIEFGYVPLTFGSGETACAAFDDAGLKVDLLLTDEKMPGLSGSELVAAVRAKGWNIPVIMMSGDVTAALKQRARAARVCALLPKPLSRDTLAAALARCLRPRRP